MKTTIEHDGPTQRKLIIEVEPDEIAPHYDQTLRRLAKEVKIPGFRKGKVPKAVLETRVGKDAIREEFLKDALPRLYSEAASVESLQPVTYPSLEVTSFEEGGRLTFTATLEVRPEITLPEYKGIEVAKPSTKATDEEVEDQIGRIRERFGTLESIGRNGAKGDYVTIDLFAYKHDEKIDAASAEDLLYEVGSGGFVPELDTELEGKRPGDILKFNATMPASFGPPHGGEEVSFQVIVKDVQAKQLPEIDDEFAKTASEFDTLEELKTELRTRIESIKSLESDVVVRNRVLEDLVDRAEIDVPKSLVSHETEHRLARLLRELERAGVELEQYLEANSATQEDLVETYRKGAEKQVAADLLLDEIADAEGIRVEREDLDNEIASLAEQTEKEPDVLLKEMVANGTVNRLAGDILRRKALDLLVEHASISEDPQDGHNQE